jgi:hypothetical protein
MSLLLSLALSANAAGLPDADRVAARYPYTLTVSGEGSKLRILDDSSREIPTVDALVLVGEGSAAQTYLAAQRARKIGAIACWAGAGVVAIGITAFEETSDNTDLASTALLLAVPAVVGTGFAVKFINPRKHLGAWVDEEQVTDFVAAHNAALHDVARSPEVAARRAAIYQDRQILVDFDGRVVDADRRPIKMKELATLLDDHAGLDVYQHARRTDKLIWLTTTGVGAATTAVGAGLVLVGIVDLAFNGDSDILDAGALVTVVGLGGVGAGVAGTVISKARHDDPTFWYDESSLRARLEAYDRDLRRDLGVPGGGAHLEVHPLVGPGVVGLTGTF